MGFLKKVNFRFTFWYRNLNMPNLCIGWLVGEVDGAAAASLLRLIVFNLLFFRKNLSFYFPIFQIKMEPPNFHFLAILGKRNFWNPVAKFDK